MAVNQRATAAVDGDFSPNSVRKWRSSSVGKGRRVLRRRIALAAADAAGERQFRAAEQGPVLAEIGRGELDQQRLHRHAAAARDQAGGRLAGIDREIARARTLGEDHELGAAAQFLARIEDHRERRIVADVAGEARGGAEQDVVHQLRLHHADGVGQARDDHHRVEQRGMVGDEDQRAFVAQAVQLGQIEAAGAEDAEKAQVDAEAAHDRPAPERLPYPARQQRLEDEGERQPAQADNRQRAEADHHGDGFVGRPQQVGRMATFSH